MGTPKARDSLTVFAIVLAEVAQLVAIESPTGDVRAALIIVSTALVAGGLAVLFYWHAGKRLLRWMKGNGRAKAHHYRQADGSWLCVLRPRGEDLSHVSYQVIRDGIPEEEHAIRFDEPTEVLLPAFANRRVQLRWRAHRLGTAQQEIDTDNLPSTRDRLGHPRRAKS